MSENKQTRTEAVTPEECTIAWLQENVLTSWEPDKLLRLKGIVESIILHSLQRTAKRTQRKGGER